MNLQRSVGALAPEDRHGDVTPIGGCAQARPGDAPRTLLRANCFEGWPRQTRHVRITRAAERLRRNRARRPVRQPTGWLKAALGRRWSREPDARRRRRRAERRKTAWFDAATEHPAWLGARRAGRGRAWRESPDAGPTIRCRPRAHCWFPASRAARSPRTGRAARIPGSRGRATRRHFVRRLA